MRGKIDGPVAARARNSVVRPKPAKDLFEAMAALRLAADQIEQPEIKEAHPRRRCQRHGVLPGQQKLKAHSGSALCWKKVASPSSRLPNHFE
jgi:hypothetical protein